MPSFAANLSMMFTEHPFLDRFGAAAAAGFTAVEFLFPYAFPAEDIRARLEAHQLTQALFNLPPGNFDAGERGVACLAERADEFREGVAKALAYADTLGCRTLHCMAGLKPQGRPEAELLEVYRRNLEWAAAECRSAGRTLLLEPINGRDMPGYLMNSTVLARQVIEDVGAGNLKLQLDLYHLPDFRGRLGRPHSGQCRSYRACADRRRSGQARARHGRGELPLSFRGAGRDWLFRICGVRIPT